MVASNYKEMNVNSTTGRVLDVLEAFLPDHTALTLTEISVRTGLSMSTTLRILARLTERGALERGPDRRYTIGQPLAAIGALAPVSTAAPSCDREIHMQRGCSATDWGGLGGDAHRADLSMKRTS